LILNFYIKTMWTFMLLFLYQFSTIHEYQYTLYTHVSDFTSRLFVTDFFINSYYLLWTNFTYIPLLLLLFVCIYTQVSAKVTFKPLYSFILILYSIHLMEYYHLNPSIYVGDIGGANFNYLLLNSINKFHPALFYLTLLLFLNPMYLQTQPLNPTHLSNEKYFKLSTITYYFLPTIIFTLFLGSWWALQEGSWGGWWNWDPSEVFGLLIMIHYLNVFHSRNPIQRYTAGYYAYSMSIRTVLFIYLFVQLNFDLVSHNFGTRINQFVDQSHTFMALLLVVVFGLLYTILRSRQLQRDLTLLDSFNLPRLRFSWEFTLGLALLFILSSSFSLLINDFYWKLFQANMLNVSQFTYLYTTLILFLLLSQIWVINIYIVPTLFLYICIFKHPLVLLLLVRNGSTVLFHILLIVLLLCISHELSGLLISWELCTESTISSGVGAVSSIYSNLPILDNFFINQATLSLVSNKLNEPVWNFIGASSTPDGYSFLHVFTQSTILQSLIQDSQLFGYVIEVTDVGLSSTTWLFLVSYAFFFYLIRKRLKFCHNKIY